MLKLYYSNNIILIFDTELDMFTKTFFVDGDDKFLMSQRLKTAVNNLGYDIFWSDTLYCIGNIIYLDDIQNYITRQKARCKLCSMKFDFDMLKDSSDMFEYVRFGHFALFFHQDEVIKFKHDLSAMQDKLVQSNVGKHHCVFWFNKWGLVDINNSKFLFDSMMDKMNSLEFSTVYRVLPARYIYVLSENKLIGLKFDMGYKKVYLIIVDNTRVETKMLEEQNLNMYHDIAEEVMTKYGRKNVLSWEG